MIAVVEQVEIVIFTMSYDAAQYQRQAERMRKKEREKPGITHAEFLSGFRKVSRLHPCITFVLFFGENWDGSRELRDLLDMTDIPEELQRYINNYSVHVIEVRRLEDTSVFHTDLTISSAAAMTRRSWVH